MLHKNAEINTQIKQQIYNKKQIINLNIKVIKTCKQVNKCFKTSNQVKKILEIL